ncbi:MAG: hypothetical protein WA071_13900 [Undibacterium umbellatum]|uniref:hypothetical protein n=1 Tax=Undibacterium umbellatum TaxID=2762300 RepID=UPI003BB4B89C
MINLFSVEFGAHTKPNGQNMTSVQKQFDQLLKQSDFFIDVIETHRRGTTNVIAAITRAIIEQEPKMKEAILEKLREADVLTGSPSIDDETRRITRVVIADILDPRKLPGYQQPSSQQQHGRKSSKPARE